MSDTFGFIYRSEFEQKNVYENLQVILYSFVALIIPIVLQGPQLLVGSIINTLLILSAFNVSGKKVLGIIFMPSIGVLIAGVLFSSLTVQLLAFLPIIWVGNAFLVFGYKYFRFKKNFNKHKALTIAILGKVVLLGVFAGVFFLLGVVPIMFLYAMSVIQLITAIIGAISASLINALINAN
jgi:hypothetical protein